MERIRNKLGVRSRAEVAVWAVAHGLVAGADAPGGDRLKMQKDPRGSFSQEGQRTKEAAARHDG